MKPLLLPVFCLVLIRSTISGAEPTVPSTFPEFRVPGSEKEMARLRQLFYRHHSPATNCTLWDPWLPMSVFWPAVDEDGTAGRMRAFYRQSLLSCPIDAEGYVATRQHRGLAHSDGWPFPLWLQAGGMGWHFSLVGDQYGVQNGATLTTTTDGWQLDQTASAGIDPNRGWNLSLTGPDATLTTPPVDLDTYIAPFIRIEWSADGLPESAAPYVAWTTAEKPEFDGERRVTFSPRASGTELRYANVPMYKHPKWKGRFNRLRIGFDNPAGVRVTLKSLITAVDSRHPTNNSVFVQACCDYFNWSGDLEFLRQSLPRMRTALTFAMKEFNPQENDCVLVPWVMLYGFLGVRPTGNGFTIAPKLPADWPSLTATGIQVQDHVIDVTAYADGRVAIACRRPGKNGLRVTGAQFPETKLQLVAGQTIELKPEQPR